MIGQQAKSVVGGDSKVEEVLGVRQGAELEQIHQGTVEGKAGLKLKGEGLGRGKGEGIDYLFRVHSALDGTPHLRSDQLSPLAGWVGPLPICHPNL